MTIKCIKYLDPSGNELNGSDDLTIGKVYKVISIFIGFKDDNLEEENEIDYQIMGDIEESVFYVSADGFEVVDPTLSANWVYMHDKEKKYIHIAPKAWHEEGFLEKYFDDDDEAILIFNEELKKL